LFHGGVEAGQDSVVAVQEVHQVTPSKLQASVERPNRTEMLRIRTVLDPVPAESLDHRRWVIARVVVHDDDLRIVPVPQLGHHFRQCLHEIVGAVMDRDDDRPSRSVRSSHGGNMRDLRHRPESTGQVT
jgi:hypothetical protein